MDKYIVFTDLDGTLLDHHTYSWEAARPGLDILRERNIPLVLVSSKTFDEMAILHGELKCNAPFIFENGGGIAWKKEPPGESGPFRLEITGKPARQLAEDFPRIEKLLGFSGKPLADMTPEEVARETGLPFERARLARMRRASLPFILTVNDPGFQIDLEKARDLLAETGLTLTRGGRFYHLIARGATKGSAIEMVLDHYTEISHGEHRISVGIGDSENDLAMLKVVQKPFLVRRHDGTYCKTDLPGIVTTEETGPAGFTEAMKSLWT